MTRLQPWLLLCLVLIAALLWSPTAMAQEGSKGPTTAPSAEVGAPIYQTRCAGCHGPTGKGDGTQAVQAGLPMPDLTDPALARATTPARWFDIISDGVMSSGMPPFGESSSNALRQVDRWDLVAFVYTLSTPPTQVAMGRALYGTYCAECHEDDGSVSADLTDLEKMASRSQTDLFSAIADVGIEGHDLGLGEVETWSLADYVRTFSYNYAAPGVADAPSGTDASTAPSPFSGGEGVVSGQVINGTSGASLQEKLVVSLRAFEMTENAAFIKAITTTMAADGAFRFEGIDPTAQVFLEPSTTYKSIPYAGDLDEAIVLSPERPEASVNITVYETTADASAIRIERLHIVFDFVQGGVQVAELYILSNDGDRAYVGTIEEGTIRLKVPADALEFQAGGDPRRYLTLADGIADTVPVPPGQSTAESILVYNLAYDDGLVLTRPMPFDVRTVNIVLAADLGIDVSGEGIRPGGPFQTQTTTLETYVADDLSAGDVLTIRLSGEPKVNLQPGSPSPRGVPWPSGTQSIAIGLIAILGAGVLSLLYWRGSLNLRLRPAPQVSTLTLLQEMADLDDDFEAGELKEKPYRTRRALLKEELIEFMEAEE